MKSYYVMFGHPERRQWEDAHRYGFVSAGGGRRWSKPLDLLEVGDEVLVHVPEAGFVGHGRVTAPACPAAETFVHVDDRTLPLLEAPLSSAGLGLDRDDPDLCEYVVRVEWIKAVPVRQAYWRTGLFFRRTTVWPLEDPVSLKEVIDNL